MIRLSSYRRRRNGVPALILPPVPHAPIAAQRRRDCGLLVIRDFRFREGVFVFGTLFAFPHEEDDEGYEHGASD